MRFSILLATVAVAMAIGSSNAEEVNAPKGMIRRHRSQLAARDAQETSLHVLHKRSFQGKATYYGINPGDRGACGDVLTPGDYTVALNQVQYGNLGVKSSFCGKTITITDGKKTTQAKVVDACPTGVQCHFGALDMSTSLFTFFNDKSVGVFDITWWVGGGNGGGSSSSSSSKSSNDNSNKNDNSDNNKSNDNSDSQDAADKAAQRAAADKKAKEDKKAAEKKAADKAKAEKKAAEKVKAEKEAKAKEEAKIEAAQKSSLNQFSQIMQTLNEIVDNSISGNNSGSDSSSSDDAQSATNTASDDVSTSTASA